MKLKHAPFAVLRGRRFSSQIKAFAVSEKLFLADAQQEFSTSPQYFYDTIHFTPAGSEAFSTY